MFIDFLDVLFDVVDLFAHFFLLGHFIYFKIQLYINLYILIYIICKLYVFNIFSHSSCYTFILVRMSFDGGQFSTLLLGLVLFMPCLNILFLLQGYEDTLLYLSQKFHCLTYHFYFSNLPKIIFYVCCHIGVKSFFNMEIKLIPAHVFETVLSSLICGTGGCPRSRVHVCGDLFLGSFFLSPLFYFTIFVSLPSYFMSYTFNVVELVSPLFSLSKLFQFNFALSISIEIL